MNDEALREAYQAGLDRRVSDRADCPDPDVLAAVAGQRATSDERLDAMEHVAQCRECQRELALLGQVVEAREPDARSVPLWMVAVAAGVVLLVGGVEIFGGRSEAPLLRGESAVELVSPLGTVSSSNRAPSSGAPTRPRPDTSSRSSVPTVGSCTR